MPLKMVSKQLKMPMILCVCLQHTLTFLRNHTSLGYKPPVQLDCLKKTHNMPNKWNILLDEALDYYIKSTMEF